MGKLCFYFYNQGNHAFFQKINTIEKEYVTSPAENWFSMIVVKFSKKNEGKVDHKDIYIGFSYAKLDF